MIAAFVAGFVGGVITISFVSSVPSSLPGRYWAVMCAVWTLNFSHVSEAKGLTVLLNVLGVPVELVNVALQTAVLVGGVYSLPARPEQGTFQPVK